MKKNTTNNWMQLYQNAARMRLDIETIKEDIEFEIGDNKRRNFYAVDTVVVRFYAAPLENKEFALTFEDEIEDESVLGRMAISLCDFIFLQGLLPENDSYLMYPKSLLNEFVTIYEGTAVLTSKDENRETMMARLQEELKNREEIELFVSNYNVEDKETELKCFNFFINKCPYLLQHLQDESYMGTSSIVHRMGILGRKKRLRNAEVNTQLPIPSANELKDNIKVCEVYRKFIKLSRLEDETKKNAINNDIETLAWLTFVNNKLASSNERLLYITTEDAVHKTAEFLLNKKIIDFNFVRHPRQYVNFIKLTDNQISFSPEEKLESLKRLQVPIDEFLKPFRFRNYDNSYPDKYSDYLENLYKFKNKGDDNNKLYKTLELLKSSEKMDELNVQFEKFKNDRKMLLSLNAMSNALTPTDKANQLALKIREKGIDKLLIAKRIEILNDVVASLYNIGLFGLVDEFKDILEEFLSGLERNLNLDNWSRGPVSLKRDKDLPGEDGFFEKIHYALYNEKWLTLFGLVNLAPLYIRYLIYALVAANGGRWSMVRYYCEKALEISEDGRNHEALYLLAIALRHDCRNYSEYNKALKILNQCQTVWKNRYPDRGEDLRFISEKLALNAALYNYKFFMSWQISDVSRVDKLGVIMCKLQELVKKVDNNTTESYIIRLRMIRLLYSTQCCLYIFDQYIGDNEIGPNEGRSAYNNLKDMMDKKDFKPSYFIHFLLAFLAWHFSSTEQKEIARKKAFIETEKALKHKQIPYEEKKYCYFLKVLENHGRLP